jgi:hypothetical protein
VHNRGRVVPREDTGFRAFLLTGVPPYRASMARYEVTLKDRTVEVIDEADAYQQEGPMTTFFATGPGRQVVDCWSDRLASFRTSEIMIIRRVDGPLAPAEEDEVVTGTVTPASAVISESVPFLARNTAN